MEETLEVDESMFATAVASLKFEDESVPEVGKSRRTRGGGKIIISGKIKDYA